MKSKVLSCKNQNLVMKGSGCDGLRINVQGIEGDFCEDLMKFGEKGLYAVFLTTLMK